MSVIQIEDEKLIIVDPDQSEIIKLNLKVEGVGKPQKISPFKLNIWNPQFTPMRCQMFIN